MKRRQFIRGLVVAGACPLCSRLAFASGGERHWEYRGDNGPDHWGEIDPANRVCSVGHQQSPINITGSVRADVEPLSIRWMKGPVTMVNNGHTIQVNMPPGNTLSRADKTYDLLQFHFHAPSEHLVDGKVYPMEVHFVHKHPETGELAVVGVFLLQGQPNDSFSELSKKFPRRPGDENVLENFSAAGLVPPSLGYWTYPGSLTTPPCSEIVTWLVMMEPMLVDARDIDNFTSIYAGNARPVLPANRRVILSSSL